MTIQSSPSTFADRHIGARRQADIDTMLKAVGYDSVDGLVDIAVPDSIRQEKPLRPRRRPQRSRGPGRAAPAGRQEQDGRADDRPGLLRHRHPAGDPPQHPRSPGLVHRVHALPAGDLPGPARGAAELPDHGPGPRRPAGRQRLAAGRSHRRRRGRAADAPRQQEQDGAATARPSSTPTASRRPSPSSRAAPRPSASRSRSPTSPRDCPTATSTASSCSSPASPAGCGTSPP